MSCDYLDCDALIKSFTEANTRLQGRLDQQDILIAAQKKRILELVNESNNQILDLRDEREITKDLRKTIQDAQQERMTLLVANKAHQEDNERLREANGRLLRNAVELRVTVALLRSDLRAAVDLMIP